MGGGPLGFYAMQQETRCISRSYGQGVHAPFRTGIPGPRYSTYAVGVVVRELSPVPGPRYSTYSVGAVVRVLVLRLYCSKPRYY